MDDVLLSEVESGKATDSRKQAPSVTTVDVDPNVDWERCFSQDQPQDVIVPTKAECGCGIDATTGATIFTIFALIFSILFVLISSLDLIFLPKLIIDILALFGLYRHNHYLVIPELIISILTAGVMGLLVIFTFIGTVATFLTRSMFFVEILGPLGLKMNVGHGEEALLLGLIVFGALCVPSIISFLIWHRIVSCYAASCREFKAERRARQIVPRPIGDIIKTKGNNFCTWARGRLPAV